MNSLETTLKRFDAAFENQRQRFDRFSEFDYIYHSRLKHDDPTVASKVFNPVAWGFIETIVTRMLAAYPRIVYKPREEMDQMRAELYSELFSYWFDSCEVYPTMVNWVKDSLIYGTGIVKIDWYASPIVMQKRYQYDETGEVALQTEIDPETGEETYKSEFAIENEPLRQYDAPRLTNVKIYDFFFDPAGHSMESCRWVIHRYMTTIDELIAQNKAAKEHGKPMYVQAALDRIKAGGVETGSKTEESEFYERHRREAAGYIERLPGDGTQRVEVMEMWEDNKLVVVVNRQEVVRDGESPYWHGQKPFIRTVDNPVPYDFYGKGEIEPIEGQIHAINTTQNQRIVNVNRILNPMWFAAPGVDDYELEFTDNGIIHASQRADVDMFTLPNVTETAVQEQNTLYDTMQRALGVTDTVQGLDTPASTAREVELKTTQANSRFAFKVKIFESMGLRSLGQFVYKLYQQFLTKEKAIRILGEKGEEWVMVKPADLIGDYDVIPESESTLEQDQESEYLKFQNLVQLVAPYFQRTDPMTGATSGFLNEREFIEELIRMSGQKNPDRFMQQDATQQQPAGIPGVPGVQVPGPQGPIDEGAPLPDEIAGLEALLGA